MSGANHDLILLLDKSDVRSSNRDSQFSFVVSGTRQSGLVNSSKSGAERLVGRLLSGYSFSAGLLKKESLVCQG
ncbi:hypothetical protein [Paraglaciecola sp.]|uniref:hypothetical protein n=1 Tax=Paraglaciecola sp. TaxID=1920173 RepID=UPI0030F4A7DD